MDPQNHEVTVYTFIYICCLTQAFGEVEVGSHILLQNFSQQENPEVQQQKVHEKKHIKKEGFLSLPSIIFQGRAVSSFSGE